MSIKPLFSLDMLSSGKQLASVDARDWISCREELCWVHKQMAANNLILKHTLVDNSRHTQNTNSTNR